VIVGSHKSPVINDPGKPRQCHFHTSNLSTGHCVLIPRIFSRKRRERCVNFSLLRHNSPMPVNSSFCFPGWGRGVCSCNCHRTRWIVAVNGFFPRRGRTDISHVVSKVTCTITFGFPGQVRDNSFYIFLFLFLLDMKWVDNSSKIRTYSDESESAALYAGTACSTGTSLLQRV
jgi:hypothetical protein